MDSLQNEYSVSISALGFLPFVFYQDPTYRSSGKWQEHRPRKQRGSLGSSPKSVTFPAVWPWAGDFSKTASSPLVERTSASLRGYCGFGYNLHERSFSTGVWRTGSGLD